MDTPDRPDDWTARAACARTDPGVFFAPCRHRGVEPGARCGVCGSLNRPAEAWSPDEARSICAGCPVARHCLDAAIMRGETQGIWAGAGGDILRGLRRLRRASPDHTGAKACRCRYCRAVDDHLARLRADTPTRAPSRNGPAVTHGRASTYARACRCARCTLRASVTGTMMHDAGIDIPTWWDAHLGPKHGYAQDAAQLDAARRIIHARIAATITARLAALDRDPAWFADQVAGVLDADHARGLILGHTELRLNTARAARIADVLGITPADLVDDQHRCAA